MLAFRLYLAAMLSALGIYTLFVIQNHGLTLIPIFFGDILDGAWPGQFNADFTGFLTLSALWTAWRHHFRPLGMGLAILALFGGIMFLAPYLLVISFKVNGDVRRLLLGDERASS